MTTNAKYTPGPWRTKKAVAHPPTMHIVADAKSHIASVDVYRSEANARLIAAAPDLLAACEAVLAEDRLARSGERGIPVVCDELIYDHLKETVWPMLYAAIAKATGQEVAR